MDLNHDGKVGADDLMLVYDKVRCNMRRISLFNAILNLAAH